MDVFDSNVWIYGLTQSCDEAVELVEKVVTTPYHVGVNAYIFDEVMQNLRRSERPGERIDRIQTRFADIVHDTHTVHGPTQSEISRMDVEDRRSDPWVGTLSELLGVQEKDVPIVVFAHDCASDHDAPPTTIFTADQDFAAASPGEYFRDVDVAFVDCSE